LVEAAIKFEAADLIKIGPSAAHKKFGSRGNLQDITGGARRAVLRMGALENTAL
jgi:hypothetical protein